MDFSKDIEKQKTVMGYPSPYNNTNILHPPNNYNYPKKNYSYNVNYSKSYIPLKDQIDNNINDNSTSFGRYITTMMLILIIGMLGFSLFIWLIFGTEMPQFKVMSLQVPTGLVITNTSMLGNWQVNISMRNPNSDLDIKVHQGKIAIFYETNLLAENNVDPFNLAPHNSITLFSNLTSSLGTFLEKGTLSEANVKRNDDGVLKFALQINMGYEYSSMAESKRERIRVYCYDVKVQFGHGPKDKGELINAENIDCIGNSL